MAAFLCLSAVDNVLAYIYIYIYSQQFRVTAIEREKDQWIGKRAEGAAVSNWKYAEHTFTLLEWGKLKKYQPRQPRFKPGNNRTQGMSKTDWTVEFHVLKPKSDIIKKVFFYV